MNAMNSIVNATKQNIESVSKQLNFTLSTTANLKHKNNETSTEKKE